MNKHEELVREIAEEMYHASFPDMNPQDWELDEFSKSARIAVKHMAEMYEKGWRSSATDVHSSQMIQAQKDIGLIPENNRHERA